VKQNPAKRRHHRFSRKILHRHRQEIKIPSATEIRRKKDRENRKQAEETKRETAKVKAVRIQGAMRKYPNFLRLYAA